MTIVKLRRIDTEEVSALVNWWREASPSKIRALEEVKVFFFQCRLVKLRAPLELRYSGAERSVTRFVAFNGFAAGEGNCRAYLVDPDVVEQYARVLLTYPTPAGPVTHGLMPIAPLAILETKERAARTVLLPGFSMRAVASSLEPYSNES